MLLYRACRYCAGGHSLTSLARQLGPISVSGLTRARDRVTAALPNHRFHAKKLEAIEGRLRASGSDLRC